MHPCIKVLVTLWIGVLACAGQADAQTFHFQLQKRSHHKDLGSIRTHGFPDTLKAQIDEWPNMTSNPTTWGNSYKFKSVHNLVKFYVYHDTNLVALPYTYRMAVHVLGWNNPALPNATVSHYDTLTIGYQADSLKAYQDKYFKKYSGYYKLWVIVTDVYWLDAGTWKPLSNTSLVPTPPGLNCRAEAEIWKQKYDKAPYGPTPVPSVSTSTAQVSTHNVLQVNWSVGAQQPYPAQYELEWTYVDDYRKTNFTTTAIGNYASNQVQYNFKNNSTRVVTDSLYYRIPLIYNRGHLVYRVRVVRPDSVNYLTPVYSNWSLAAESGLVSTVPSGSTYAIGASHAGDAVNWQYTLSFAEDGKNKQVLNYFDGSLKSRQTLTRFNSDPGKVIVGQSIYDYEGRPALSLLPTPVPQNKLEYVPDMTKNAATNQPYGPADFDVFLPACPTEPGIPGLHATSPAARYYSPANPDQAGYQKFVPDAKGYPYVRSILAPEDPKRVLRQGGAGHALQIGTDHDTKYFYVSPDQAEIDRLFGTEIGRSAFYKKTVVTDPNGQSSYSVTDNDGRTIATGMIGLGPDSLTKPVDPIVVDSPKKIRQDLLAGELQNVVGNTWTLSKSFFVEADGNHDLQYQVSYPPFLVCAPNKYLTVSTDYHYELFDGCGIYKGGATGTIGQTGMTTSSALVTNPAPLDNAYLTKGPHFLNKSMTLQLDDVYAAVDTFMDNSESCLKSEDWFIRKAVERKNFPCPIDTTNPCASIRQVMISQLYAGAKYGLYSGTGLNIAGTDTSILTRYRVTIPGQEPIWKYRYQMCQAVIDSLPDTAWRNGVAYTNLATMPVDSFVWLLNYNDTIAKALLPLHPEYCKLKACHSDSYTEYLESIPDYQTAEGIGRYLLNDLVNNDPLFTGGLAPFDSLARIPGGAKRLDSLSIAMAYCAGVDTGQFSVCYNWIYQNQITAGNISTAPPVVKTAYFDYLISLYAANRANVKQRIQDAVNNSCGPCADWRMHLIPQPLFPSATSPTVGVTDSAWLSSLFSDPDNDVDAPDWILGVLTNDTIGNWTVDSATAYYNAASASLCDSVVGQWMDYLGNCSLSPAQLTILRDSIRNYYCYGAGFGKPMTSAILRSILVAKGYSISALCNPYLVSLKPLPSGSISQEQYACKPYVYYFDAAAFFNRSEVKSSLNSLSTQTMPGSSLSGGNSFEAALTGVLGVAPSHSVSVASAYNAASKRYQITLTNTTTSATADIWLQKKTTAGSCGLAFGSLNDWFFATVNCLLESEVNVTGAYINQFSFTATVAAITPTDTTMCEMLGWGDKIPFVDTATTNEVAGCISCLEAKRVYARMKDTLSVLNLAVGHPLYRRVVNNFLDEVFDRQFAEEDYMEFLASCGISDSFAVHQLAASYRLTFANAAAAQTFADNFLLQFGYTLQDYRYTTIPNGAVTMLVSLGSVPQGEVAAVVSWINGSVTAPNRVYDYRWPSPALGVIFVPNLPAYTPNVSFAGADLSLSAPSSVQMHAGSTYDGYTAYTVQTATGLPPYKVARYTKAIRETLWTAAPGALFSANYADWIHADYSEADKQAFLAYNYGIGDTAHNNIMRHLQSDSLMANIGSYAGKRASYEDPFIITDQTNLFVAAANQSSHTGYLLLNNLLTAVKNHNLTFYGAPTIFKPHTNLTILGGGKVSVYRCGNNFTWWYRYFDANDKLYDFFVNLPDFVTNSAAQYAYDGMEVGSGDGDAFRAAVKLSKIGAPTVKATGYGYSDFAVGNVLQLEYSMLCRGIFDAFSYVDTLPCERPLLTLAVEEGKYDYRQYRDSVREATAVAFLAHLKATISEKLNLSTLDQKYHFTLYYYDRAGNLTQTVPPSGVVRMDTAQTLLTQIVSHRNTNTISTATLPVHQKKTTYRYNTLNQVYEQYTPDGGRTDFYYDAVGRVVFSQNDKQRTDGWYSYTLYDGQGRIKETGEGRFGYVSGNVVPPQIANASTYYTSTLEGYVLGHTRRDVVATRYDEPAVNLPAADPGLAAQQNLRKRVSCVKFFNSLGINSLGDTNRFFDFATHYSYDITGNVKTLTQDFAAMPLAKQRYKRVDYEYDLLSGKVNLVAYNRGYADQFYQRYFYDADNRITAAETSKDGIYWDADANYKYYQHGPLARMGVGDLKVQGADYAYTVQGWLKAMNTDALDSAADMGKDGSVTVYAKDVLTNSIDYFPDDYDPIGSTAVAHVADPTKGLYNGNITRQTTGLAPFPTLNKQYHYDPLNRITRGNYAEVDATFGLAPTPEFRNRYRYDADGNIKHLFRMGNKIGTIAQRMDSITYYYAAGNVNNRLLNVTDSAANAYGTVDIPYFTSDTAIRFRYDAIGNLTKDRVNGQDSIYWNLYGKVKTVRNANNTQLDFAYDGAGNRIVKTYKTVSNDTTRYSTDYYVRDAQGNILAVMKYDQEYKQQRRIRDIWVELEGAQPGVLTSVANASLSEPAFSAAMRQAVTDNSELTTAVVDSKTAHFYLAGSAAMTLRTIGANTAYFTSLRASQPAMLARAAADRDALAFINTATPNRGALTLTLGHWDNTWPAAFALLRDTLGIAANLATGDAVEAIASRADEDDAGIRRLMAAIFRGYGDGGANGRYALAQAILGNNTLYDPQSGYGQRNWAPLLQSALGARVLDSPGGAHHAGLADFFGNQPQALSTLKKTAGTAPLVDVAYALDAPYVLAKLVQTQGTLSLADVLTADPNSSAGKILLTAIDKGAVQVLPWGLTNVLTKEHYYLAEHHLYGSSRLGIKNYWPTQHHFLYNGGTRPDPALAIINQTKPWYSQTMLDFMKPGIGGYATASADLDKTAWYSPRILGQKHYEFSDHLGNVQSVTLDRLTPVKATPTTIGTWRADLAGVWDYYPFGMYMPGRNVTDNSAQCVTISQPGLVAIRSRWWTQWYEPAVMAEQGPLIGLWRVAGGWQAPGSYLETFEGQPLLHAVVSQRGMGMERAVDVTPGSEYEVEATIDNREAGAELLYEVVHYFDEQGIEEPEVLASIPVARSGRYLLSFSSGDYEQVHVRVVARDVRGQARIKLGPISWWNITYVPGGEVLATVCNGKDAYPFGFNRQEKVNEIAGVGNHTTALFWEYDSRLGRRWNRDPKPSPDESQYATNKNNPIQYNDPNGDCPPGVECGVKASLSLTMGTRGQSRANFAIGVGASKTSGGFLGSGAFMSGANLSLNMYSGGPGTDQANTGRQSFGMAATLGLSGTWGGGTGTPTDLNIFNSSTLSGIKNNFAESYTVGTNITWNTATGWNRAAGYATKQGGFTATFNEDFSALPWGSRGGSFFGGGLLASGLDEGETGGIFAGYTFSNGVSLYAGTEIFTGKPTAYPKQNDGSGYVPQLRAQQQLNVGRTFLMLQGVRGGDWRLDYSGRNNMFSQNVIHDVYPGGLDHFRSTAPGSLQITH